MLKEFDGQQTLFFEGIVRDTDGNPIEGVMVDVWEDAPNGLYENHDPDQPEFNLRGRFMTDENGRYAFIGLRPTDYPIPDNETAGELLRYMGHHPMRPGHMHFLLAKDGFRTLISQVYDSTSEYLANDSVFAVKKSLIGTFEPARPEHGTDLYCRFDFTLAEGAEEARIAAE